MCSTQRRNRPEALALVRQCFTVGDFIQSKHFRERLAALTVEKDVTIQDVIHIGQHGGIYNEPEPDPKHGEWKYTIEGTSPDGLLISMVFSFKADGLVLLITIFIQR